MGGSEGEEEGKVVVAVRGSGKVLVRRQRSRGWCQVADSRRGRGESGKGGSSGREVSGTCRLVCGVEWRQ